MGALLRMLYPKFGFNTHHGNMEQESAYGDLVRFNCRRVIVPEPQKTPKTVTPSTVTEIASVVRSLGQSYQKTDQAFDTVFAA